MVGVFNGKKCPECGQQLAHTLTCIRRTPGQPTDSPFRKPKSKKSNGLSDLIEDVFDAIGDFFND